MIKKLDPAGQIAPPECILDGLGLKTGSKLEFNVVPGGILLTPLEAVCTHCGAVTDLIVRRGSAICRTCLDEFNAEVDA